MESNDLSNQHSSEHIFCGFSRRRSSQITTFENYYYGMDEGSDQTIYSEDDDEYDETNADDVDCESSYHNSPKHQAAGGRLSRRNIATRLDRGSEHENTFRSRSKWKKYHYHAVPRAMPIQEEDEETAGPSSTAECHRTFNGSTTIEHEHNNHIIIHVNDVAIEDDELSFDDEIYFDKKSISENDSLLVAYDSNSITSSV